MSFTKETVCRRKSALMSDHKASIRNNTLDIQADLLRSAVENIMLRLKQVLHKEGYILSN